VSLLTLAAGFNYLTYHLNERTACRPYPKRSRSCGDVWSIKPKGSTLSGNAKFDKIRWPLTADD